MNIFFLDNNPRLCAEWSVDRHCVKMILETAQLLSTAHRILDGTETVGVSQSGRKKKIWQLSDDREALLYSATHINHPSAVWVRQSNNNYLWLWCLLLAYLREYTYRYGKVHSIERSGLFERLKSPPNNIPTAYFKQPPSCMDAKYVISEDSRVNYKNYYKHGKAHLHAWKKREVPEWMKE